jgi:hypothetical protein
MSAETDRDPFALAREGEGAGDPLIRKLFRQWIEENRFGSKADGQEAVDASCDRMLDIEQEIADLPTQSFAGLAIKIYLHLFWAECSCHMVGGDPARISATDDYGPHAVAILRDAARLVPEIAELVGGPA